MMLTGKNVALRPFDRKHLARMREWANGAEVASLLDCWRPLGDAEHEQWFASLQNSRDVVLFALEAGDEHVGNIWLWGIDWRHHKAEVRVLIGSHGHHGKGLGSEAIDLVSRYGFGRLNLHRLYAHVPGINPQARRAFEKAGYEAEGLLRADRWVGDRYADVHLLGRLRDATPAPGPEATGEAALPRERGWQPASVRFQPGLSSHGY